MKNLLAQTGFNIGQPIQGVGPLGNLSPGATEAPTLLNSFFSGVVGVMSAIAAIWFVVQFITGAIGIVTSEGEKGALESARKKITTGVIGMVVIVSALFIVDIIGRLLGIDLILDPGQFVETFTFN